MQTLHETQDLKGLIILECSRSTFQMSYTFQGIIWLKNVSAVNKILKFAARGLYKYSRIKARSRAIT
jgi:hypothetical protein